MKSYTRYNAFTLIELLIVIGITATLSGVGLSFYANQQRVKLLDKTAQEIIAYLKHAQQNSVAQKNNLQWGVHFENSTTGKDFYALYTGETYSSPIETRYLPAGIEFETPSSGNSINISFNKLTGTNYSGSSQSIVIQLTASSATTTISVSSQGLITY